jgi:hypothetical protein
MSATITHGVLSATLAEVVERARRAEGSEVSVRVLGSLRSYDADEERGELTSHDKSPTSLVVRVDLSALRRDVESAMESLSPRVGSLLCVVGEARLVHEDEIDVIEIRARVVRPMDGLDPKMFSEALAVRRRHLNE